RSSSVGSRSSRLPVRRRRSNSGHSGCATGGMIRTMTTETMSFRQRVLRGDILLGAFLNLDSPAAAELCARAGFDWLIVDLEHGAGTEASLVPILTSIEGTAVAALVRPASGE